LRDLHHSLEEEGGLHHSVEERADLHQGGGVGLPLQKEGEGLHRGEGEGHLQREETEVDQEAVDLFEELMLQWLKRFP